MIRQFCVSVIVLATLSSCLATQENGDDTGSAIGRIATSEAWRDFQELHANQLRVEWNERTGTPRRIRGTAIGVARLVDVKGAQKVAEGIWHKYQNILGVDPTALVFSKADYNESVSKAGSGTWYIYYHQTYQGLPVHGGSVRLVVREDLVTSLGSDYYPDIDISATASVALEEAVARIRKDLSVSTLQPLAGQLTVYPRKVNKKLSYELTWRIDTPILELSEHEVDEAAAPTPMGKGASEFPVDGRQASEIVRTPGSQSRPVQWRYFVDAHTGTIISREQILVYEDLTGQVTGDVRQSVPNDPPSNMPIQDVKVTIKQGDVESSGITDASGNYAISNVAPGPGSLEAQLKGPHLEVHNSELPDPDATHTATVSVPGSHVWSWATDDVSPSDVETSAFYHLSLIGNWFRRGGPFNIIPFPDPMVAHVRDRIGCNAMAGSSGLFFFSGDTDCEDFALCSDIVYHEFVHRVVAKIYDEAGVALPYINQTGAMNEAWADYFGCSVTGDPEHGEGCYSGRNLDTGRYGAVTPVDNNRKFYRDWAGEVHQDGVIFGGALWDVRTVLGNNYTDSLILRTMKLVETSFSGYLGGMLEEDDDPNFSTDPTLADNNAANGTPNIDVICHAFVDFHEIYHPYCAGHHENLFVSIASPDHRAFNLVDSIATPLEIKGSVLEGTISTLAGYSIEYAHFSEPSTWLSTGVTLSNSGRIAITDSTLGQIDLSGLADGLYVVRLTATAHDASTVEVQTSFVLDTSQLAGWPVALDITFRSSPAVADIDPAYPGLEIVANAIYDCQTYAWHADGTVVPGWPVSNGCAKGGPSIGDVDRDGQLEVFVASGYLYGYEADGTLLSGWPQDCGGYVSNYPVLADIDGDGDLEIIAGFKEQLDGGVCAFEHDGSALSGWPVALADAAIVASPAVGDLDNNGLLEVVAGSMNGTVYAFDAAGAALAGWPQTTSASVGQSAVLGDLDGDGEQEIAVGTYDGSVFVWHRDGTRAWTQTATQGMRYPSSATMADLDDDGDLEVIMLPADDKLAVWHGDGMPISSFPPLGLGFLSGYEIRGSSPSVGDIDGDGYAEIVVEESFTDVGDFKTHLVFAFNADGSPVTGWPRSLSTYSSSTPVITDLDQDGTVEVLVGTRGVFAWELLGQYQSRESYWPTERRSVLRTGSHRAPLPDLVIESQSHFPSSATTVDMIVFDVVVKNVGPGPAGASTLGLAVGGEATPVFLSESDAQQGTRHAIPALVPGENYTIQRQISSARAQNYINTATADVDNVVEEVDESNNQQTYAYSVELPPTNIPDLTIESLTYSPSRPTTDDEITFTAVVANVGGGTAQRNRLSVRIGGEEPPHSQWLPRLRPGARHVIQRKLTLTKEQAYLVTVTADSDNSVVEANEMNNSYTRLFVIVSP